METNTLTGTIIEMKVDTLKKALEYVQSAIAPFNVQDIYSYIRLIVSSQEIELIAGNNTYSKKITIPQMYKDEDKDVNLSNFDISGETELDVCVLGSTFLKLLKSAPNKKFSIYFEGESMVFRSGGLDATLPTLEGELYPGVPYKDEGTWITIPYLDLIYLYNHNVGVIGKDLSRPELSGLSHQFEEDILRCLATNRVSIGGTSISLNHNLTVGKEVIVPLDVVKEVLKIKPLDEIGGIDLRFTDEGVLYAYDNKMIYSTTIEGSFPSQAANVLERSINEETPYKIILNKSHLMSAINLSSIYSDQGTIMMIYSPEADALRIKNYSNDHKKISGSFNQDYFVETKKKTKDENDEYEDLIYFNLSANHLKNILTSYSNDDKIEISFFDKNNPVGFKVSWEEGLDGHTLAPVVVREGEVVDLNDFSPDVVEED